jgi:hypothetical protein
MRRFFIRIALAAIIAAGVNDAANAQWSLVKGDNLLSAAIGFGGYYSGTHYSRGTRLPIISVYYENCVVDNLWDENSSISVGGMLSHTAYSRSGLGGFKTSNTVIGARGALHYQFVDNLDTYAGLFLGYDIVSRKLNDITSYDPGSTSSFTNSLFIGARYYFNDTWAAFGEIGVGLASLNLGVTYKF